MVNINTQQDRDGANLDSLERLLLYSCQAVRSAIVKPDNSELDNKTIAFSFKKDSNNLNFVVIDAKIPYSSYFFNSLGGYLLGGVQTLSTNPSPPINFVLNSSLYPPPNMPSVPNNLTTFEQLIVWSASILEASPDVISGLVKTTVYDANPTNAYVQINAEIEFVKSQWLLSNNLLNNLLPYVPKYNLAYTPFIVLTNLSGTQQTNFTVQSGTLAQNIILTDNTLLRN